MIFELENIGPIKKAKVELGNITLLCGKNNTGKTYIAYSIYGWKDITHAIYNQIPFLPITTEGYLNPFFRKKIERFEETNKITINLKELNQLFLKDTRKKIPQFLATIFGANSDNFTKAKIICDKYCIPPSSSKLPTITTNVNIKNGEVSFSSKENTSIGTAREAIIISLLPHFPFFILPAERTNTRLFLNELDKNRSDIIRELLNKSPNKALHSFHDHIARFAQPIQDNLNFVREFEYQIKFDSFLSEEFPSIIQYIEKILGIEYQNVNGQLFIKDPNSQQLIPYYMASTSARSLADLYIWLKHVARKGDTLFIDEPEINLHPENQIKIARLFAKLVNAGIKIFITTHSNYIIKELNNLVMLSNDFEAKQTILEQYDYAEDEKLLPTDIKPYLVENGTANPIEVDKFGLVQTSFDEAIIQLNEAAADISYQLNEEE